MYKLIRCFYLCISKLFSREY